MKALLALMFFASALSAETIVLDNKTSYSASNNTTKIAIQWASSAQEVQQNNATLIQGKTLSPAKVQYLTGQGKEKITVPKNQEYFRIVTFSKEEKKPELLTNWVEVVSGKTYELKQEHLSPVILMIGMGC